MISRPPRRARHGLDSVHYWLSQALQYETRRDIIKMPGIVHWAVPEDEAPVRIECLLYFDLALSLRGILNYYPEGSPFGEQPHDTLTLVHPGHRRQGIGRRLTEESLRLWPQIDLTKQSYTDEGWALAQTLLSRKEE